MKRNKIYLGAATFLMLLIVSTSCTKDFEEINTDNNRLSLAKAAPDMLLTNAIESMTNRVHEIGLGHEIGSCWVQHMAKVQYTDEDRYIPRLGTINNTWSSFYAASGMDINLIYQLGVEKKNNSYQGVALIMKSYIVSVLTDQFGDVPYSEAFMGSDKDAPVLSPKYDTQESIYKALLANLEKANTLLQDGHQIGGDILFKGDLLKWRKFANSLRLRLLLRQSDRVSPKDAMTEIFGNATKYPLIASNGDNVALNFLASAPNNNPLNENRKTRDDHRVSNTIVDFLYTDAPSPDYRVVVYAEQAANSKDWVGLPNGMQSADAGLYLGNGLAETSKIGKYFTAATAPGMLMSYAELLFIKAEAIAKGYITGDVEATYHDAIRASWDQFNANGEFKAALSTWKSTFVGWGMSATADIYEYAWQDFVDYGGTYDYVPSKGLEQIATQKWAAMFDQGLQASFEWRRTGFPRLTPAVDGDNGGKIPVRLMYPSDEATRNGANLSAAVKNMGGDTMNTRVWWDVAANN